MSEYIAPIRDMQFVLNEIAGLEEICALPGNEECSVELVESILDEAGAIAARVTRSRSKVSTTCWGRNWSTVISREPAIRLRSRALTPLTWKKGAGANPISSALERDHSFCSIAPKDCV